MHTKCYLSFVLTLAVTSFSLNQWFSICTKAVGAVFNHLKHDVETYCCIRGIALKNSLLRKSKVLHDLGYLGSLHSHHSYLPCICFPSLNLSSNQNTFLILVSAPPQLSHYFMSEAASALRLLLPALFLIYYLFNLSLIH